MHHRCIASLATAAPIHAIGEGIQYEPGDVVPRVAVLVTRVPKANNEAAILTHALALIARLCARRIRSCSAHIAVRPAGER